MPESFIVALVLLGIALLVLPFWRSMKNSKISDGPNKGQAIGHKFPATIVLTLVLVAGLFTINASFNTIEVRHIGIETQLKKPVADDPKTEKVEGVHGAGPEWVKPWNKVEEWDANYELWDHTHDNADENHKEGKGMLVKIAGNQDAWVPVSVEYAPNPENAAQDFVDYARNRDNWIARRVYPTLTNVVSNLFRTHDPLASANVDPVTGQVNPPDMAPYKVELDKQLKAAGTEFKIRNLYIGTIVYNQKTTDALQKYANLVLDKRNLEQEEKNQAVKNRITNDQAKVDALTYCLQIQEKTGTLCLIGSNSPVIVDAAPKK